MKSTRRRWRSSTTKMVEVEEEEEVKAEGTTDSGTILKITMQAY